MGSRSSEARGDRAQAVGRNGLKVGLRHSPRARCRAGLKPGRPAPCRAWLVARKRPAGSGSGEAVISRSHGGISPGVCSGIMSGRLRIGHSLSGALRRRISPPRPGDGRPRLSRLYGRPGPPLGYIPGPSCRGHHGRFTRPEHIKARSQNGAHMPHPHGHACGSRWHSPFSMGGPGGLSSP